MVWVASGFIWCSGLVVWGVCGVGVVWGILLIFVVIQGDYLFVGILCPNLFYWIPELATVFSSLRELNRLFFWGTT